jgi:hypothetical protein
MICSSLLDALSGGTPAAGDPARTAQTARLAATFVDSALADWQRVLDCEQQLASTPFADESHEARVNRSLYQAYQQWSAEAGRVLARARELAAAGFPVQGAQALEQAHGRAAARLKLTPEMMERATAQARRGEGVPLKELRDELRARVRA